MGINRTPPSRPQPLPIVPASVASEAVQPNQMGGSDEDVTDVIMGDEQEMREVFATPIVPHTQTKRLRSDEGSDEEGPPAQKPRTGEIGDAQAERGKKEVQEEHIVFIKGMDGNLLKLDPRKVMGDIQNNFGRVKDVKRSGESLMVICRNREQCLQLLKCRSLAGQVVAATEPRKRSAGGDRVKFIIFGVPLDIPDGDLAEGTGAVACMRLAKRDGGVLSPTTSVVLSYNAGTPLPRFIRYFYQTYRPKLFIPRPLRCHHCNAYGHVKAHCRRATPRCPICAEGHTYEMCTKKGNIPKCTNCGGAHTAAYKGCPAFQKAQEVTRVVTEKGLSYRDALVQVRAMDGGTTRTQVPGQPMSFAQAAIRGRGARETLSGVPPPLIHK